MSRPTALEHFRFVGDKRTQIVYDIDLAGSDPEVAAAVEAALFEEKPKRRYMVAPNQVEAEVTIRRGLQRLLQLNEGQPYTYDRVALKIGRAHV